MTRSSLIAFIAAVTLSLAGAAALGKPAPEAEPEQTPPAAADSTVNKPVFRADPPLTNGSFG